MDSPPVPSELLVDIFLRLPDPADLVRASAACVSFGRLVADRSFLRQYRKLHAPPLLGVLFGRTEFKPAIAPHPSAPAASAVAVAADFSFSFLPAPASDWVVQDIRDGRVLLGKDYFSDSTGNRKEIVVCDPLHRQYLVLPPIPDELYREVFLARHTFLVPPAGSADTEESAFRVIWMARRRQRLVAIVFSSSTGQWQDGPSCSWSNSFDCFILVPGMINFASPQYAYGCFYWVTDRSRSRHKLLVLDTINMEFSIADVPLEAKGSHSMNIAIVEAGEGRPGMFVRSENVPEFSFVIRRNSGVSPSPWQLEKTISLGIWYAFAGSAGSQLFLISKGNYFSLDVKTLQLEKICASDLLQPRAYSNFPPSLLSSPTVANGGDAIKEEMLEEKEEMLEQGCAASSSAVTMVRIALMKWWRSG